MQWIEPKEQIWVNSYKEMFEDLSSQSNAAIDYCSTDEIYDKFTSDIRYSNLVKDEITLVSAFSDLGLVEQEKEHPNEDLTKLAAMFNWEQLTSERKNYTSLNVGPACYMEKCNPTHKYSVKMNRFTFGTFSDIPENIKKWYTTNLNVVHPKLELIPFGLNNDGPGSSILPNYMGEKKTKLLYVNFQQCTLERVHLNNYFRNCPWATFKNPNLNIETFLQDVSSHKFTLCPLGNGLDSYRIWEALYLGSIPIIPRCPFSAYLEAMNLPVLVTNYDRIFTLNSDELNAAWNLYQKCETNYEPLKKSYWKNKILGMSNDS